MHVLAKYQIYNMCFCRKIVFDPFRCRFTGTVNCSLIFTIFYEICWSESWISHFQRVDTEMQKKQAVILLTCDVKGDEEAPFRLLKGHATRYETTECLQDNMLILLRCFLLNWIFVKCNGLNCLKMQIFTLNMLWNLRKINNLCLFWNRLFVPQQSYVFYWLSYHSTSTT